MNRALSNQLILPLAAHLEGKGDTAGHVTLTAARVARSCKDWHHLLELCGRYRVLLADADGVYDPTDHSDRLLLGLHRVMNEAELHGLKQRMYQGKLNKARRGELFGTPPIGYVRVVTGEWAIDPDEQVRAVVRLVVDQFDREVIRAVGLALTGVFCIPDLPLRVTLCVP